MHETLKGTNPKPTHTSRVCPPKIKKNPAGIFPFEVLRSGDLTLRDLIDLRCKAMPTAKPAEAMDENENILFVVIGVTAAVVLVLAILVWVSMKILSGQGRQGGMVHEKTATRKSSPSGDVELAESPTESDL